MTTGETLARPSHARRLRVVEAPAARSWTPVAAGGATFGVAALVAAVDGGYFPTAWGWSALVLLWLVGVALFVRRDVAVAPLDLCFLGGLGGLAGWIWLSPLWSASTTASVAEGLRALVYVSGAGAALLLGRRHLRGALGGLLAAATVVSAYALLTRLLPDRIGSFDAVAVYRLAAPLGYWNALGIFAVMGILVALGLAGRGRSLLTRALAASALVILVPTLYFTFSRGAWAALAAGLAAALAADRRRLQLVAVTTVLGVPPALAVWLCSRSEPLTRQRSALAAAARDGHRIAFVLVGLAAAGAVLGAGLPSSSADCIPVGAPAWRPRRSSPWPLLSQSSS